MNLSSSPHFANLLIPFCEAASINYRNADSTLKKRLIVSFMAFIEPEILHNTLFPGEHFDWKNAKEYLHDVQYTTTDWIQFVSLIDFSNEIVSNQQIQEMVSSALAGIKMSMMGKSLTPLETMRLCFAKGGVSPSWDTVCKALTLCSIADIDLQQVFQFLLASTPATESSTIHDIIRHTSTICKHSPKEYHEVFKYILNKDNCHVRSHILIRSLEARNDAFEKRKMSQLAIINQSKKPSLSYILEVNTLQNTKKTSNEQLSENANLNEMDTDSFSKFCEISRLNASISIHIKRALYYIKCLPRSSITEEQLNESLLLMLGNDTVSMSVVSKMEITNPDIQALKTFISEVYYTGAPSSNLKHFHQNCMSSSNVKGMNWTIVFRLYLAMFCRHNIAKELWMDVLGKTGSMQQQTMHVKFSSLVSNENEKNIQSFLQQNPININEIIHVIIENVSYSDI